MREIGNLRTKIAALGRALNSLTGQILEIDIEMEKSRKQVLDTRRSDSSGKAPTIDKEPIDPSRALIADIEDIGRKVRWA